MLEFHKRPRQILRFAIEFYKKNGHYPTTKDISTSLGLESSNVTFYTNRLRKNGFITKKGNTQKMIVEVKPQFHDFFTLAEKKQLSLLKEAMKNGNERLGSS